MPRYKLISKNNRKMYFVGEYQGEGEERKLKFKLTSPKKLDAEIVKLLEVNNEFSVGDDANVEPVPGEAEETPEREAQPEPPKKICIFDGAPGEMQRFVNGQTVYLCEMDYYDKSIGKIVQRLRENVTA